MKPFEGFKSERMTNSFDPLPVGQYIAKITGVKMEGTEPFVNLILRLDITEGEYAGYFTKRFKAQSEAQNSQYEVKYKGVYRITVPHSNQQYCETNKKRFGDFIAKIEESNSGYTWNWDEKTLNGKVIGINVRESSYNGKKFTEIGQLESVDDVRNGKCKELPPRAEKSNGSSDVTPEYTTVDPNDVEIPF